MARSIPRRGLPGTPMPHRKRLVAVLAGAGLACSLPPVRAADGDVAEQIITNMNKAFGTYPATRANHAKGVVYEGTFTPGPEGAALSSGNTVAARVEAGVVHAVPTIHA
jgi:catalase